MQSILTKTNKLLCSHCKKHIPKGKTVLVEVIDGELNCVFCMECEGSKREYHELQMKEEVEW